MRVVVTKLFVHSFDLDHLDIYWEIDKLPSSVVGSDTHEIFDYDFYVSRSGDSSFGPYEQIAGPFRDQYRLRDVQVSLLHKWRDYHYKLKVVHRPTGEEKEFGPVTLVSDLDLVGAEIIRQEDTLFREFTGRKCWLFTKRTFGPICSCFDPVLGRKLRGNHDLCFGTGFLGGYLSPIEVFVQIDPVGKSRQTSAIQEMQPMDTSARMISFPTAHDGDILVETENKRWRIGQVTPTERLRSPVHQELVLHAIPKGDIEFALPLNVDPTTLEASASRNFTNPQTLKANEDVNDILTFFGRPWRV